MNIIDAHQHFWQFDPKVNTWIEPGIMEALRKDFLPEDLVPILDEYGINATIAVQAEQSESETDFLIDLAEKYDFIAGVVGWVDLCDKKLGKKLEKYSENKKLRGFRHVLQGEKEDFMIHPDFIKGLKLIHDFGYTYDILVYALQLESVIAMIRSLPEEQKLVIDHIAKPNIKDGRGLKWERRIREIARHPNTCCKISGMITEAHWIHWAYEDFIPYLDVILDAFGPDRCMFGSDWPVCLLAGTYGDVINIVNRFMEQLSAEEKDKVMGDNCLNFYALNLLKNKL